MRRKSFILIALISLLGVLLITLLMVRNKNRDSELDSTEATVPTFKDVTLTIKDTVNIGNCTVYTTNDEVYDYDIKTVESILNDYTIDKLLIVKSFYIYSEDLVFAYSGEDYKEGDLNSASLGVDKDVVRQLLQEINQE